MLQWALCRKTGPPVMLIRDEFCPNADKYSIQVLKIIVLNEDSKILNHLENN